MGKQLEEGVSAPDFELKDTQGKTVHLSDYCNQQPVVIVFTRGFI